MNIKANIIRAIAIDFDWTLVNFNIEPAFTKTQNATKDKYPEIADIISTHFAHKNNMLYFHLYRDKIWHALINTDTNFINELHTLYWEEIKNETSIIDNAIDFLVVAKELDIKTIIVTNNDGVTGLKKERIIFSRLDNYVDEIFIAGDHCQEKKPDFSVFIKAAEKINVPTKYFLMVGDKISEDIIPAAIAGMQTILFRSKYGGNWEPSVSSYRELISHLFE